MKPITKKVIEAGLVPKHTILLMQKWGYLDPEATADVDERVVHHDIKSSLTKFVEELDELLEAKKDEDIKETSFSITLRSPFRIMWLYEKYGNYSTYGDPIIAFKDEMDRIILPASESPSEGRLFSRLSDEAWFEITSCTPLWADDTIVAYQIEAEQTR